MAVDLKFPSVNVAIMTALIAYVVIWLVMKGTLPLIGQQRAGS